MGYLALSWGGSGFGACYGACVNRKTRISIVAVWSFGGIVGLFTGPGGLGLLQAADGCSPEVAAARRALVQAGRAVVGIPVADLYERADVSGPLADQALFGELVTVPPQPEACRDVSGELVLVETKAPYKGYVPIASLWPWPSDKPAYLQASALGPQKARLRVTARLSNVYRSPDVTLSNPRLVLPLHSELKLFEIVSARWLKVELPDGGQAYIQRGDVEMLNAPLAPSSACLVAEARKYEGTPYLWGGRSTLGIDCSGLVSNAFMACGVIAPRDAGPQMAWSALVAIDKQTDLQPGDLLFFGSADQKSGSPPKVAHVGIFVGAGRFLHATTSERPTVHESPLSEADWQRRYLGARRYRTF